MSIILVIALVIILLLLAWALFGSGEGRAEIPVKKAPAESDEPENILRRRASDRAIEREFPEEQRAGISAGEPQPEAHEPAGMLQLPFSANEIIPDNSRFKLYRRTLINSEVYAKKGDIETAISLFRGVRDRILDSSVREKIDGNIEYLNHFRQRRDEDIKKKIESRISEQQQAGGELRLKIDGPVPSTINIGLQERSIDSEEIVSKISDQIAKELGTIRSEVDRLKSKPEEKFDLDDYAEFAGLQHELKVLKEKFSEITDDREKALKELSRLRELKEQQIAREEDKGHSDLLNQIREEMEKLNTLKNSLDKLHDRFDDMAGHRIPETEREPSITEARYEAPIPIHFDRTAVLEILEKLTPKREVEPEKAEDEEHPGHEEEPVEELLTSEELKQLEEPGVPGEPELLPEFREEELFPEPEIFPEPEVFPEYDHARPEQPAEAFAPAGELPELTDHETDELIDEYNAGEAEIIEPGLPAETTPVIPEEEIAAGEEFIRSDEPEAEKAEAPVVETTEEIFPEMQEEAELPPEPVEEAPLPQEEILPEPGPAEEPAPPEQGESPSMPQHPEEKPELAAEEPPIPEEILKSEKEKEIERYTEAEEDPNAFDLLSEYGKPKDDSTLTDEDIFEKILKEDRKKTDDSQFEIIGERQRDEQEYNFDDSRLDEKKKSELDFYKKFIKPDRIKKRELPILRVSYDFKKLPDEFSLSREKNILEYSFYKYKPMLQKADEFIKHRQVRDAINYYKVVADQNIPVEFKAMIRKNIRDLTEYLEKYLSTE